MLVDRIYIYFINERGEGFCRGGEGEDEVPSINFMLAGGLFNCCLRLK
jgi:hypothetical protein